MPGARTHDFITLVTAAGADIAYLRTASHPDLTLAALFTGSYLFAGYACAGDLDLVSREYYRWGPFRFIWWPYRVLVPHRSWLSHGLLFGGIFRLGYLAGAGTLLFWLTLTLARQIGAAVNPDRDTDAGWQSLSRFAHAHPQWTLALLSGFVLAGATHSIADIVWTGIKRRL